MLTCFNILSDPYPYYLILGTIINPESTIIRQWKRTYMKDNKYARNIFVTGILQKDTCSEYQNERHYNDMLSVMIPEGIQRGNIDKAMAFFTVAPSIFPKTKYIAKVDEETYVNMFNIYNILRFFPKRAPYIIAGWMQHSYINKHTLTMCGHMILNDNTNYNTCKNTSTFIGPYHYPASGIEILSYRVCESMNSQISLQISKYTNRYWESARQDLILGYILNSQVFKDKIIYINLFPYICDISHIQQKVTTLDKAIAINTFNPDLKLMAALSQKERALNNYLVKRNLRPQFFVKRKEKLIQKFKPLIERMPSSTLKARKLQCKTEYNQTICSYRFIYKV